MNTTEIRQVAAVYRNRSARYALTTLEQRQAFLEVGHKCWGCTEDGDTFVICRSPTSGELAEFTGESLEQVLYVVAMLGMQKGADLDGILDVEENN